MTFDPYPEYLTIEQAAAYRRVSVSTIRRVLRAYGMTEFARTAMNKQVLIRRSDLDEMSLELPVRPARPRTSRSA